MDPGEQTTGTRDEHYNLISVLYHALQGADTCNTYALDAEAAGNERLSAFFREAGAMQAQIAERAKGMLGIDVATSGGATPEPPPGDVAGSLSPGDMAGGIPPRSADAQAGGVLPETPPPGETPGGPRVG